MADQKSPNPQQAVTSQPPAQKPVETNPQSVNPKPTENKPAENKPQSVNPKPVENKPAENDSNSGPGESEKKLMQENKPKNPLPQPTSEIVASNPLPGGTAPRTNVNENNPKIKDNLEVRTQGVAPNEVGPTGKSGTDGTGPSGITVGNKVPQNTTKTLVFTTLLADSKLRELGFTHVVAYNESRQFVAAFASEEYAVKFSDLLNA